MKHIIIVYLFSLALSINVHAQGVNFENTLSWRAIKEKAKAENKKIFIDFYATWCGPCKLMDEQVYNQKEIGELINRDFISVKIQTDKTAGDDKLIKAWYKDAAELAARYSVAAMPTLLFVNPNESVLNSSIGFKSKEQLMVLAKDALSPESHYGKLKESYLSGKLDLSAYPLFASKANASGDGRLGLKVLQDYKNKYYDKMSLEEVLKPLNLKFLLDHRNLISSRDRIFKFAFKTPEKVDKGLQGLAQEVLTNIIDREEVQQKLWRDGQAITMNPDWELISGHITKKYGEKYVNELVPVGKHWFYYKTNQWKKFAAFVNQDLEAHPIKAADINRAWDVNQYAWETFSESDDKEVLAEALRWSNLSIEAVGDDYKEVHGFYDTKANLLHKMGRTPEAVVFEKKAIDLKAKFKTGYADYKPTLELMEKGLKTW